MRPFLISLGIANLFLVLPLLPGSEPTTILVEVLPQARVSAHIIRVGDVARLSGGSQELRERIAALDLQEFPDTQQEQSLTRQLIRARILVSDLAPRRLTIVGATESVVSRNIRDPNIRPVAFESATSSLTDHELESRIARALSENFSIPPADLTVRLSAPVGEIVSNPDALPEFDVEPPQKLALGRTSIRLRILQNGRWFKTRSVPVEIAQHVTAPIARTHLKPGSSLDTHSFAWSRIPLHAPADLPLEHELAGSTLRRPLAPGDIIHRTDLNLRAETQDNNVVKPRDLVRLVVRKANLTVSIPAAEVLQPGKLGDVIRVRNPDSGRILSARVLGPREVEVPL